MLNWINSHNLTVEVLVFGGEKFKLFLANVEANLGYVPGLVPDEAGLGFKGKGLFQIDLKIFLRVLFFFTVYNLVEISISLGFVALGQVAPDRKRAIAPFPLIVNQVIYHVTFSC